MLPWPDSNRRPLSVCWTNPASEYVLTTELHDIPCILIPSRKLRSATTASIYPIRTIGLACQMLCFRSSCCDCIATIQRINTLHVPTQPDTTTYQPYCSHRDLTRRSLLGRNLPLNLAVLTDWIPSFPRLHLPVYFDAAYLQDLCINNLPTCRDCLCASLGVAEGEGFEPPFCCRTVLVLRCHCLALLPLNHSANLPVFPLYLQRA